MPSREYRITLDVGKIIYIKARSRGKAIEQYCKETGVSKEWVRDHCKVENLDLVNVCTWNRRAKND